MKSVQLNLLESDTKFVLEALLTLEEKWASICSSSSDEDEIAEYGNDLVALRLFIEETKKIAVNSFGKSVLNFDRTSV